MFKRQVWVIYVCVSVCATALPFLRVCLHLQHIHCYVFMVEKETVATEPKHSYLLPRRECKLRFF